MVIITKSFDMGGSIIWHDLYKCIISNKPFRNEVLDKLIENKIINDGCKIGFSRQEWRLPSYDTKEQESLEGLKGDKIIFADCFWRLKDEGNESSYYVYHEIKTANYKLNEIIQRYELPIIFENDKSSDQTIDNNTLLLIWSRQKHHEKQPLIKDSTIPFQPIDLGIIDLILDKALLHSGLIRKEDTK